MFVRLTRGESPPDRLEELIANYRQSVPRLSELPGNLGAVLLVDRATGRGMAISYWDSADSLQASEEAGAALRAQVMAQNQGKVAEVDRFELLVQERTAPPQAGTFVRVNDIQGSPDRVDDLANLIRDTAGTVRDMAGFRAILMGANRQSGRMFVASVWDTAAARDASEASVQDLRRRAAEAAGAANLNVELFESAFAEVRLPTPA